MRISRSGRQSRATNRASIRGIWVDRRSEVIRRGLDCQIIRRRIALRKEVESQTCPGKARPRGQKARPAIGNNDRMNLFADGSGVNPKFVARNCPTGAKETAINSLLRAIL